MKITHRQLRRVIKEEVTRLLEVEYDEKRYAARELVQEYETWHREEELMYPPDSLRGMASYIIDKSYIDKLTDDPRGATTSGMGRNPEVELAFESYYGIDVEDLYAEVMDLLEDVMSGEELQAISKDYSEDGNHHPFDINRDGKLSIDGNFTISEGSLVSLQPIKKISRPIESNETRWMRIAGITEEVDKEKWPNTDDRQAAVDKVVDIIASAGLNRGSISMEIIRNKLENETDTILTSLVDIAGGEVPAQLKKWYEDNVKDNT